MEQRAPKGISRTKATLLLVEDSRMHRMAASSVLTKAGYTVRVASDGEEGLKLAQEITPGLILLDMMLPKLGGLQVLQRLKQDPHTRAIPVIVLSGLSQANESKLISAGAAAYLEKDSSESEAGWRHLLRTIEVALQAPGAR